MSDAQVTARTSPRRISPSEASGVRRQAKYVPKPTASARREHSKEKADVIATVARTLTSRSAPPLDARLKSILAAQVGHLLRGGYSAALITNEAVTLCHEDPQKLASIGAYVRTAQSDLDIAEHQKRKREAEAPLTPEVQALLVAAAKRMNPHQRPETHWTKRCSECERTALYGLEKCAEHERGAA